MPTLKKSPVSLPQVAQLILKKFHPGHSHFTVLDQGNFSTVFSFHDANQDLVIKIKSQGHYNNEVKRYQDLSQSELPLSRPLKNGVLGPYAFLIATRCPGKTVSSYLELLKIQEDFTKCMSLLHQQALPIPRPPILKGSLEDWEHFLTQFIGAHARMVRAYQGSPQYDAELFQMLFQYLIQTAPTLNAKLYPIHGDLNGNNIFIHNQKISGLIDFSGYFYGDYLYDYTWFLLSIPTEQLMDTIQKLYRDLKKLGMPLEQFKERILTSLCHGALIGISFFTVQHPSESDIARIKANIRYALKHLPQLPLPSTL